MRAKGVLDSIGPILPVPDQSDTLTAATELVRVLDRIADQMLYANQLAALQLPRTEQVEQLRTNLGLEP